MIADYLGNEISIGERGIRVHSYGHSKDFKKITVKEIDESRRYGDSIGIITDGNSKIGWTYPKRIIVQKSFKTNI
jgi:hypothetical protein